MYAGGALEYSGLTNLASYLSEFGADSEGTIYYINDADAKNITNRSLTEKTTLGELQNISSAQNQISSQPLM